MPNEQLNENPAVRQYLQDVTNQLYNEFQRSNFYEAMSEYLLDGGSIGTATIYAEDDIERGRIRFSTLHPKEVYIAENEYGEVDTHYRRFQMTARNFVRKFAIETNEDIPEHYRSKMLDKAEKHPDEVVNCLHAVFPREDYRKGSLRADQKRIASLYIDLDANELVRESGYDLSHFATWRWRKNSDEEYGRSPAWDALRDVKMLQEMEKADLTLRQKEANPALWIPEEFKNKFSSNPGARNFYKNPERLAFPVTDIRGQTSIIEKQQQKRDIIREHFKVDFFLMLANMDKTNVTATEIIERQNEKMAILTATVGRFATEALNPLMDIVFSIAYEAGRLPEPPQILVDSYAGGRIDVDYIGPLAQAQKRLKTQGTQVALQQVIQYAQVDPSILDRFNLDEAIHQIAKSHGIDQEVLRSDDEVAEIRQMRQQQQAAQQQAQMAAEMANSKAGTEKPEEGSILSQLMGAG